MFTTKASTAIIQLSMLGAVAFAAPSPSSVPGTKDTGAKSSSTGVIKPLDKGPSVGSTNSTTHAPLDSLNLPPVPSIIVCSGQSCTGECIYYEFEEFAAYTCYESAIYFLSAEVYSPGGVGLPYGVYPGLAGCDYPVQLPVVNTCYNLFFDGEPADFSTFYIT